MEMNNELELKHIHHHTIIICVFACATIPTYKAEIIKIEETWGKYAKTKNVLVLYFLGEEQTDLQNDSKYIYLKNINNDYDSAFYKQNLGLKYIYENYNTDFVFCCGTDTYINIENLLSYVKDFDCEVSLYIGGHSDNPKIILGETYYFHCGGAGFILSKKCLHNIYLHLYDMINEWYNICKLPHVDYYDFSCDVALSYFLQKLTKNLKFIKNNTQFFSCNYHAYIKHPHCWYMCSNCIKIMNYETLISCHCMTSENFDNFTKILEENNYYIKPVKPVKPINQPYEVISFGHKCTSAGFIDLLNSKYESYPFDWMVSKLDVIQDCIETDFIHFLNKNNYIEKNTDNCHIIDNNKEFLLHETVYVNTYYENKRDDKNDYNSTYHYKLILSHRKLNTSENCLYYERCIARLYNLLKSDINKYYIHFHPIIGINDFEIKNESILNEFESFNKYINTKTINIFGIYFILIKHQNAVNTVSVILKETPNYIVYVINCNNNFKDTGKTMSGDMYREEGGVLQILNSIIQNQPLYNQPLEKVEPNIQINL